MLCKGLMNENEFQREKIGDVADIYSFEYKGHKYIMFNTSNGLFVIIDPDDEK